MKEEFQRQKILPDELVLNGLLNRHGDAVVEVVNADVVVVAAPEK